MWGSSSSHWYTNVGNVFYFAFTPVFLFTVKTPSLFGFGRHNFKGGKVGKGFEGRTRWPFGLRDSVKFGIRGYSAVFEKSASNMQKAVKEKNSQDEKKFKKGADDLEKELGM